MPSEVIVSVGSGRDYATLDEFHAWAAAQDLVGTDTRVTAHIYDEFTMYFKTWDAPLTDATRNFVIRPAPGFSFAELVGPVVDYPSSGLRLRISAPNSDFGWRIGRGFVIEDFRIDFASAQGATGSPGMTLRPISVGSAVRRCAFYSGTAGKPLFSTTNEATSAAGVVEDSLFVTEGFPGQPIALLYWTNTHRRCSFVSKTTGTPAVRINAHYGKGPYVQDCLIVGDLQIDLNQGPGADGNVNSYNNYLTGAIVVTGTGTSYDAGKFTTIAGGAVDAVTSPYGDLRPKPGSVLIGAASVSAAESFDLNYVSRGSDPSVGALAVVGDTLAPTLTTPTATALSDTTASGTISTNESNGTLYHLTTAGATATATEVKAGASQAVTATGTQTVSITGLTASTAYYTHYLHRDAAGNDSTVSTTAQFTTAAPPVTLTTEPLRNNTGTLLANETGATLHIYEVATGNKVATKTGQTTNASGIMTAIDGSLVSGTAYRYVVVLASGAEGLDTVTAA